MGFVNGFLTILGFGLGLVAVFGAFCLMVIALDALWKRLKVKQIEDGLHKSLEMLSETVKDDRGHC